MRSRPGSVLFAILVIAALSVGVPAALSQQAPSTQIVVKTRPEAIVVDLKSPGFSAGDMVLLRGQADDAATGENVGVLSYRCQRLRTAADNTWALITCDGELKTDAGKITFSGTRMQGEAYMTGRYAITGGTGAYETAGGSVLTADDDARNKWTFNIVDLGQDAPPA